MDSQSASAQPTREMFSSGAPHDERQGHNWMPWVVACVIVVVGLGLLAFFGGHGVQSPPAEVLQPSAYAPNLQLTNLQLSQAKNFAGGQVTYIDGNIANRGNQTVNGITVAVTFANAAGEQPQIETIPLLLIRTREPYIDTEAVSSAPLAPGSTREFRLVFDNVSPMWDQQTPKVQVMGVQTSENSK